MVSCFDEKKATEMAAYFLRKADGRRMSYLKLLKLLYIADREALRRWGYPLTGDSYFSLDHGPVNSRIMDLIREDPQFLNSACWTNHIQIEQYDVELMQDIPVGRLSQADIELLDEVFREYGHLNKYQLRDLTHDFPEWEDPKGSRLPITYQDILKAVGRLDEAEEIAEEIEMYNFAKRTLNCP